MEAGKLRSLEMIGKQKEIIGGVLSNLFIIFLGLMMLYPIVWIFTSSLKSGDLIFSDPSLFPENPSFKNFVVGWQGVGRIHFSNFFKNSIFLCGIVVAANVCSCTLAAFAFGRLDFSFKKILFAVMMLSIMLPHHVTTIPRYIMFFTYGWTNTYLPLIVPKILATDAFFVFLLVQFIRGLPMDLDEAATIEGCGKFGIFFYIIIPLSVPAMVTTAIFSFLWTWDDFFNQLLYLNTASKYTVPLGLRMFLDSTGESSWGPMFAMSILSMIPCFVLFFSLQKYFVRGISTTGLKG
jgi:multiple sugar transport system permease protein